MRIIAGRLGGRLFESPGTFKTHPMGDKIRGALFNTLGDIAGLSVLDPFAGSGALGFEAISRGAAQVLLIDQDRVAQRTIRQNIRTLGLVRRVKLISASANAWLTTSPANSRMFDIVICDPPYQDLQPTLLQRLAACVKPGGVLVLSYPADTALPVFMGCTLIRERNYGDATLAFYRSQEADS